MKYLGIDYGTSYVGFALSDETGEFAFPEGITKTRDALSHTEHLIQMHGIETVVIGCSVAANGADNTLVRMSKMFAQKLPVSVEVVFQDEGFSSFEAHRYQTDAGRRDDSAAAIILQRFLDKKKK